METRTGYLISRIAQVQARIFQRLLQKSGVDAFNGPQGRILYVLWQRDGVPIGSLVKGTGLAKNTLTVMLARMEEAGLIRRTPDDRDRRQSIVSLTEQARALRTDYEAVSREMNELYFPGFTDQEAAALDGLLDRVLENLEETEKNLKRERK